MSQPPDRAGPESGHTYPGPPPGPGRAAYPAYGYPASSPQIGTQPRAPAVAPSNTSAVVLLVVSVLAALATGVIGIPSAVVAVLALRSGRTDPAGSRRTTRLGWIVLAANAVVGFALLAALFWWLSAT